MAASAELDISEIILEKRLVTVETLLKGLDELVSNAAAGYDAEPGYSWWLYAPKEREPLHGGSRLLLVKAVDKMLMSETIAIEELDFEGRAYRVDVDTQTLEQIVWVHEREFGSRNPDSFARSLDFYLKNDAFLPANLTT